MDKLSISYEEKKEEIDGCPTYFLLDDHFLPDDTINLRKRLLPDDGQLLFWSGSTVASQIGVVSGIRLVRNRLGAYRQHAQS